MVLKTYRTMPFVKITLSENYAQAEIALISDAIHRSLIREFHIPEADYFHVISRKHVSDLKFPEEYLGIKHDQNIVYIQIIAAIGRTVAQKRALYHRIALQISETTSVLPGNIMIILLENDRENWSLGNGEIQEFKHL